MRDLKDRVALVTGASRGVGRGTATALSDGGARVSATGRTFAQELGVVDVDGRSPEPLTIHDA